MKIPVYDLTGKKIKELTLGKTIFGIKPNKRLISQAIRVYLANQRMASAQVKTRGEVNKSTKKIYRQKGTGGARHGSRRAPIFVGGGKAHGAKKNQHFGLKLPKKMKVLALKSALSYKLTEQAIYAVEGLSAIKKPSTKKFNTLLKALKPKDKSVGIVVSADMDQAVKSARNIPQVSLYEVNSLTTYEVLKNQRLLFAVETIKRLETRLGPKTTPEKAKSN